MKGDEKTERERDLQSICEKYFRRDAEQDLRREEKDQR